MSGAFRTTRWSLVARARDADRETAARALGELCEQYWPPLYAWLRRRGHAEHDALDLVQAFCAQLLERGGLDGADRTSGVFRGYLLGALRNFVGNEVRRQRAQKRGGRVTTWSLDDAEAGYAAEPDDGATPERVFERRWARAVLDRAAGRLRDECAARGRLALLQALEPALSGDDGAAPHRDVAARLGTTEGAVKVALHRMRARLRELIRDEVAETLATDRDATADADAIDAELRVLLDALGGPRRQIPPTP